MAGGGVNLYIVARGKIKFGTAKYNGQVYKLYLGHSLTKLRNIAIV
jgi:hypothetical protein